jgi:syntaxin 5
MSGASSEQALALIQNDTHIQERAEAMTELEATITEVQDIFIEMAGLIGEQGTSIQRIDENVDNAESSVGLAQEELVKALKNVTSNKWLMLKIGAILMAFFILFIVVFA